MVTRRYGIYLRVFTSISNEWAQRMSEISNEHEHEDKFHISKRPCIILFIIIINLLMMAFLTIFRRFPTTFRRFPKIFQNCSEGQTNVPEHFLWISENSRRCPKISEDSWRLSRKIRRCFDDTLTNLSTIKDTKLISEKLSISSHVKLS